jgi:hypothetical protein
MQQFTEKYTDQIVGILSGFDRLVFRGSLRRLNYGHWDRALGALVARGMEEYLWQNKILFKHYAQHVKQVSERLKQASLKSYRERNLPVIFLRSSQVDKEKLARRVAEEKQIRSGPVCALSSLEPSPTFEHRGKNIIRRQRPCGVLYHYQIHPEVGWMYARIQTWFPFNVQIGLNGREWRARQMARAGLSYHQQGNCLVGMEDYPRAQALLDQQLKTNWAKLCDGLAEQLNPIHESVFEQYSASYYWTCHQSEWATDIVFRDAAFLKRLMRILVPHGMLSFSSRDVLRYFSKRVNRTGAIPASFNGDLQMNLKEYREGERVKYCLEGNSSKFYDKLYSAKGNVLRAAETTINRVSCLREYRPKEGGPKQDLQWRPLRKGIAGLHRRAEISQKVNERVIQALASVDDSRRVEELTAAIQQPVIGKKRRVRALRPWGDDKALLAAINHGDFLIHGFRNRDLQRLLYCTPATSDTECRRRSAAISRKLGMLKAHGLIRKIQHTHRYQVSKEGQIILVAVLTTARTTLQQINQLQVAA